MANKATPNLPASSRMQMPSGGGSLKGAIKETGGMKGKAAGVAKKVMAKASKKGMASKKGY